MKSPIEHKTKNMPVKPNFDSDYLYFLTTTASGHKHFFKSDTIKRIIVDSFHFMRTNHWINLYAFVIMPNHIHVILRALEKHTISDIMRDFKKHTSKQITRQFQAEDAKNILLSIENSGRRDGNKVWEDNYDARDVFTTKFLQQKLDYIHHNPCQPHWNLSKFPEGYMWSSAAFYMVDKPCIIPIDDVREIL